jgi:cell wall-associated NlpC family hydrolase
LRIELIKNPVRQTSFAQYIGIPYELGGRDKAGADCWGIVRMILRDEFGKELPDFPITRWDPQDDISWRKLEAAKSEIPCIRVTHPKPGDICVLNLCGRPTHVGIFISANEIIHTLGGIQSVIERIESPRIKSRIEGFYRVI